MFSGEGPPPDRSRAPPSLDPPPMILPPSYLGWAQPLSAALADPLLTAKIPLGTPQPSKCRILLGRKSTCVSYCLGGRASPPPGPPAPVLNSIYDKMGRNQVHPSSGRPPHQRMRGPLPPSTRLSGGPDKGGPLQP